MLSWSTTSMGFPEARQALTPFLNSGLVSSIGPTSSMTMKSATSAARRRELAPRVERFVMLTRYFPTLGPNPSTEASSASFPLKRSMSLNPTRSLPLLTSLVRHPPTPRPFDLTAKTTFETSVDFPIPGGPVTNQILMREDGKLKEHQRPGLNASAEAPAFVLPRLALVREGSTDLYVPAESLREKEPKTYPAFFNPAGKVNRDVSVAIAKVTGPATFLDALSGTGARGVRVAREASKSVEVTLVEFNETSLEIARMNARRNGVVARCEMVHEESNAYLHSRFGRLERFDAVDIDPFGTPAPYVQGALSAADDGAVVSVTATDTATLCGVFPHVAKRRYGAAVLKSEFAHEAAVRVLFGFCARVGGVVDTGIQPLAAHSTLHYLRVYFRVVRGARNSDECLRDVRYVETCAACHESVVTPERSTKCPRCGGDAKCIGPQWTGKLIDEDVVARAAKSCSELGWKGAAAALDGLEGVDAFPPFGYSMAAITSREKVSSVSFQRVVELLEASGRSAMRQPFGSGLKTDASYAEILAAVRQSG